MGTRDDLQKKEFLLNELKAQAVNALASDQSGRPKGSGLGTQIVELVHSRKPRYRFVETKRSSPDYS